MLLEVRVRLFWRWLEVVAIGCLFLEFALEFVVVFRFDAIAIVASDDF
jgi:hypothetical protein